MMDDDDDLLLLDDDDEPETTEDRQWTIMIVDDDEEVHNVTTLALGGLTFSGWGLNFVHAYSGVEAQKCLAENPDTALILLDVVMESDHAGLEFVDYVRNVVGNPFVRIILRTGQPGQSPEIDIIRRYDINDYKHKTELTRERLFTTIYTSLGAYRDLISLERNRQGLEKVIDASATILELDSLERFAQGVLEQLTALLFLGRDAVILRASGASSVLQSKDSVSLAAHGAPQLTVIAGTGAYQGRIGEDANGVLEQEVLGRILNHQGETDVAFENSHLIATSSATSSATSTTSGGDASSEDLIAFYVESREAVEPSNRRLVELFCKNVSIAWRNLQQSSQ